MSEQANPDLLFQREIREAVRTAYREIPSGAGRAAAERHYSPAELSRVPEPAITWALGVGNPVRHATLSPGEVVLDLGCGGGIDSVLAARRVGASGRVIGLDLLPEMCDRAAAAAEEAGVAEWCEFRVGEMESIPLPAGAVDAVVSNGVLNLSPRKSRALAEVARVLAPGGRVCFADLTVDGDLPPEVLGSEAAWAGCIAGAVSERVLGKKLSRAGLVDVAFAERVPFGVDDVTTYPLFSDDVVALMRRLIPAERQGRVAVGLIVKAAKPLTPATGAGGGAESRPAPPVALAAGAEASPPGAGSDAPALAAGAQASSPGAGSDAPAPGTATGTARLDDLPAEAVEAIGVTVRHLKSVEDVHLKVMDVAPGNATPFHTHPHAHEGVIVSGAGRLRLSARALPLRPGDVFSVNPTDPHAIECDGEEPLRLVCMDCFVQ